MAGSADSDSNRQSSQQNTTPRHEPHRQSYDDENPFIAFRRYADEQISSLLQSVMGLPSTLSTPSSRDWLAFQNDSSTERYPQRQERQQYGSGQNGGQQQDNNNTSNRYSDYNSHSTSRRTSTDPDFQCHHHHHPGPLAFPSFFFDSLQDTLGPIDPFPFPHSFFHTTSPFSDFTDSASWPIPYILFSPYSPLHLERQRQLRDRNDSGILSFIQSSLHLSDDNGKEQEYREPPWRDAFEDLMRLENGKGMLDRGLRGDTDSRKEAGGDWLAGLMERGSLGDQWKPIRGGGGNGGRNGIFRFERHGLPRGESGDGNGEGRQMGPEDIDELESLTELDLYEDFLRGANGSGRREDDEFTMTPLLRLIFEEQERRREELQEQRRQWQRLRESKANARQDAVEQPSSHKRGPTVDPDIQESVPDQSFTAWRSANSNTNTDEEFLASANSPASRDITSTSTSTERKVLPDGSIQTKVVRRTCFADGTEESNETVNVLNNPRQTDEASQQAGDATTPSDEESGKAKSGGGWFWKE
ncbi:hypothetical protein FQN54_009669 [Arachnomyces sp. PD_36]|nr:hypothetical protein FQN54_009669 [Arachnomyces sp. PD_36]